METELVQPLDQDIPDMDRSRLEGEVRQLRRNYANLRAVVCLFLHADGNDLCHENRQILAEAIGLRCPHQVRPLPFFRFLWNCLKYRLGLSRFCRRCG